MIWYRIKFLKMKIVYDFFKISVISWLFLFAKWENVNLAASIVLFSCLTSPARVRSGEFRPALVRQYPSYFFQYISTWFLYLQRVFIKLVSLGTTAATLNCLHINLPCIDLSAWSSSDEQPIKFDRSCFHCWINNAVFLFLITYRLEFWIDFSTDYFTIF